MAHESHTTHRTVQHGVTIHDAVGPSFQDLRRLSIKSDQPVTSGVFPVYEDLGSLLATPKRPVDPKRPHPDVTVAHVLAVCAGYSYSDADTVALMMTRMGLENCRCRTISEYVDAMFIMSTAYIIQSEDGKVVILSYRGTEPGNIINWLTDADLSPDKVEFKFTNEQEEPYDVHAGFYRNVRSTRFKVAEALERALEGLPVTDPPEGSQLTPLDNPMETLYITGHSLGAAMAAIMGITIQTEPLYRKYFADALEAVYTFGQPMIGTDRLADASAKIEFLNDRHIRYIYQKDPVPHLPPTDTGPLWRNFGREYQFTSGKWRKNAKPVSQMRSSLQLLSAAAAFVARQFPALRWLPFAYQFSDHGPQNYIAALTPRGGLTEFGDHSYVSPQK